MTIFVLDINGNIDYFILAAFKNMYEDKTIFDKPFDRIDSVKKGLLPFPKSRNKSTITKRHKPDE